MQQRIKNMSDIQQRLLILAQKEENFKQQYENGLVALKNELEANISSITAESLAIKQEFVRFINDESVPLRERWDFFVNAPNTVKETSEYIPNGRNDGIRYILDQIGEEYSPEEFKTFYTVDLIDRYFNINYIEESGDDEELHLYESAIEGFLEKNCGSFVFTW